MDRFLKAKEIAGLLQVSEGTVKQWVSKGKIPFYKINGALRFSESEVEAWTEMKNKGAHQRVAPGEKTL